MDSFFSDFYLIDRFNNGDSLVHIAEKYWQEMFDHAFRMLADVTSAQDVVKQIFSAIVARGWINRDIPLAVLLHVAVKKAVINLMKKSLDEKNNLSIIPSVYIYVSEEQVTNEDILFVRQLRDILLKEVKIIP